VEVREGTAEALTKIARKDECIFILMGRLRGKAVGLILTSLRFNPGGDAGSLVQIHQDVALPFLQLTKDWCRENYICL
jgi:hypothetical protein